MASPSLGRMNSVFTYQLKQKYAYCYKITSRGKIYGS